MPRKARLEFAGREMGVSNCLKIASRWLVGLVKHRSHLLTQITQNNNLTQTLTDKSLLRLIAKTVAFLQKQVAQLEALRAENRGSVCESRQNRLDVATRREVFLSGSCPGKPV
jgi:hypothetical protein